MKCTDNVHASVVLNMHYTGTYEQEVLLVGTTGMAPLGFLCVFYICSLYMRLYVCSISVPLHMNAMCVLCILLDFTNINTDADAVSIHNSKGKYIYFASIYF